ncbi:MAG: hypothetical protein HY589_04530 [Candidatus Omnitrophica bacterium]|nr:hypothetical protein [Candidatus Omnitrophota bacterium]
MLIPGTNFLIDYLEQNEGVTPAGPFGTSTLTYAFDTADKHEGTKSLRLNYTYVGTPPAWGAALAGNFPVKLDISPYSSMKLWAKKGSGTGTGFAVKLAETGRAEGNEEWKSPNLQLTDTWSEYTLDFSNFTLDSALGNNRMDRHSIGSYILLFGTATGNGAYYVDAIELISQAATISVPPGPGPGGAYEFGTVNGSLGDHRFVLPPIPVTFGGFAPPWTVRIWTNNNPPAPQADANKYAGLKGADGVNYIPLKVWCSNFGPTSAVPDEENDYFYSGYDFGDGVNIGRQYQNGSKEDVYTSGTFDENYWGFDINGDGVRGTFSASTFNVYEGGFWYRIPEYNEMDPANKWTWRRLTWTPEAQLQSPFNIYLAIDTADAAVAQLYQTTVLMLEYINE